MESMIDSPLSLSLSCIRVQNANDDDKCCASIATDSVVVEISARADNTMVTLCRSFAIETVKLQ
jgi:hypothetical protein